MEEEKIRRTLELLGKIWMTFPNLKLGNILEIASGREVKITLDCTRKNFMADKTSVGRMPIDLKDISTDEWIVKLEEVVRERDSYL